MIPLDLNNETAYSVVVFGASGRLSITKVFPALWALFRDNQLPQSTKIFTFSRDRLQTSKFRLTCVPYMGLNAERDKLRYNSFWTLVHCMQGEYDNPLDYKALNTAMVAEETKNNMIYANRMFYLAVPLDVFDPITLNISRKCKSHTGWNRIVLERPFASNDKTFRIYQTQLCQTFKESQIFMMDRLLSKKVVMDMLALRFANRIWNETWDMRHIAAVMVTVKYTKTVVSRPEYFDQYGIIRDMMVNQMIHMVTLLTMEQPRTDEVEDLRDEKLKILKDIVTIDFSDVVLGQYINNGKESDPYKVGYREHSYIPNDSLTPTYCMIVLRMKNNRWAEVPFILRAGRALNETKTEIRVQYKPVNCDLFDGQSKQNELVLRLAPTEKVFMRLMLRHPGEKLCLKQTDINMSLDKHDNGPLARYHTLLMDVFEGNQMLFNRTDEICEIWRIFSPILSKIEVEKIRPLAYYLGSRGPIEAFQMAQSNGFRFHKPELWDNELRLPPISASAAPQAAASSFQSADEQY